MERLIEATAQVQATFERARDLLLRDAGRMLGAGAVTSKRTFVIDLSTTVGKETAVHEEVQLEILAVHVHKASAHWDLSWRAVGHPRVFPVFRGTLSVWSGARTIIRLAGTYKPPLGLAGVFGDGVVGHRIARRTLEAFVEAIGHRIDHAGTVRRSPGRTASPTPSPVPG